MTASKTKSGDEKKTKAINSIHIVLFTCPNCGEEFEELRLCQECKSPMKVIQVIEKFGAEADEYLAKLKKEGVWEDTSVRPKKEEKHDGGISATDDDELDDIDIKIAGERGEDHEEEDDDEDKDEEVELIEIFPEDDDDKNAPKSHNSDDLKDILDKLDEEDTEDVDATLPEL